MGKSMTLAKLQMLREGNKEPTRQYPQDAWPGYGEHEPPDMRRRNHTGGERYDPDGRRGGHRMGFDEDKDERHGSRREGSEPIHFGGMIAMEGGKRTYGRMTREMAEEWTESMEGADPSKPHGAKWTPEQVRPIAVKYGVPTDGERFWEFFAVMNAMYSDYYAVAKKYNTLTPEFFADLTMAFINDKDAVENKAVVYYECIVEK